MLPRVPADIGPSSAHAAVGRDIAADNHPLVLRHCLCLVTVVATPLPCVSAAFVAKTLPLRCFSTASVGKTLPLPCVSAAFVAKTLPLRWVSAAFVGKTLPLPCITAACAAKTLCLPCVSAAFVASHYRCVAFSLPVRLRHCISFRLSDVGDGRRDRSCITYAHSPAGGTVEVGCGRTCSGPKRLSPPFLSTYMSSLWFHPLPGGGGMVAAPHHRDYQPCIFHHHVHLFASNLSTCHLFRSQIHHHVHLFASNLPTCHLFRSQSSTQHGLVGWDAV